MSVLRVHRRRVGSMEVYQDRVSGVGTVMEPIMDAV